MGMKVNMNRKRYYRRVISPVVIVLLWELLVRIKLLNPVFIPTPSSIAIEWWRLLLNGILLKHVSISLARALSGFTIGSTLAIIIGISIGWKRYIEDIIEPPLELLRSVPPVAFISVALLWFGIGNRLTVFIISWACFFPLYINTIEGVKGVELRMVQAARTLGAKPLQVLFKVIVPSAMPMIFAGLRTSLANAMMAIIVTEMIGAQSGLGYLIMDSERYYFIDTMFAGIATISILGFLFGRFLLAIEAKVLAWHRKMSMIQKGVCTMKKHISSG